MKVGAAIAVAMLFVGAQADAATQAALNFPTGMNGNQQTGSGDRSFGYAFTVNSPITINDLGAFDNPGNGLGTFGGTVSVAIYSVTLNATTHLPTAGTLLGNVVNFYTGEAGMTHIGNAAFLPASGISTLHSGTYMVVANHYGNPGGTGFEQNYASNNPNPGTAPSVNSSSAITVAHYNYLLGSWPTWGNSLPTGWTLGNAAFIEWAGPNFEFAPVPEAAQFALAGVGLLGLVYIGRSVRARRSLKLA